MSFEQSLEYYLRKQYTMEKNMQMFLGIMVFYILLSYIIGPLIFYYLVEKSLTSAGNGFVLGSLISIALWYGFGSKMIRK